MNHEGKRREELFTDPEELVTLAQAYYATEFPNDERRDCPPLEALREVARSGALPGGHLSSHLFACSECFRSYRSARMSRRPQAAPAERRERLSTAMASLRWPWAPAVAGAFSLVFLSLVTATLLRRPRIESPAVAVTYSPQETPAATPPQVAVTVTGGGAPDSDPSRRDPGQQVPERPRRATKASPKKQRLQPPLPVVYVDLKEEHLLRGDDEAVAARRVIKLTPERQRLRLRMPRGSAAGRYTVKVVDAYGKPLLTRAARSGGRTLTVDLDLRGLTAKPYRLCLSRDGEAPDCYQMSIINKPTAP